jgi:hypothetical protein
MLKTLRVALAAVVVAAGAVLGTALPSGAEPSATIDDIVLDGCDIVVTFTVGDAGEYHLVVYDDQVRIGDVPVTAGAQATVQGRYTLTAVVKQGASGLGIQIRDADDNLLANVDPYNGADDVIDFCAEQNPITTAPPATPTTTPPATEPPATDPPAPPAPPVEVAPVATPVDAEPVFTG